jgi:hypothetical protein
MGILKKNKNIFKAYSLISEVDYYALQAIINNNSMCQPDSNLSNLKEIHNILTEKEEWRDLIQAAVDNLSGIYTPGLVMSRKLVKYCRLDDNGKLYCIHMKPSQNETDKEPEFYEGVLFTEEEIEIVKNTISILDELIEDGCNINQIVNARDTLHKVIENIELGCQL